MQNDKINLYINRYGYIFPSCKTYKESPIAKLDNSNVVADVKKHFSDVKTFNSITVELSSLCHASCIYCFQRDGRYDKYKFFDELKDFLKSVESLRLFFSGGEILDQRDSMAFLSDLRSCLPDIHFHLKTNGDEDVKLAEFVESVFDSVVISLNGFSDSSCKLIMGDNVDVDRTLKFARRLVEGCKTNVGIKYLISPATVCELPQFFSWALELRPKCIILQAVYLYKLLANGKSEREKLALYDYDNFYWTPIIERIRSQLSKSLEKYEVNVDVNHLAADCETAQILQFDKQLASRFRMDGIYDLE